MKNAAFLITSTGWGGLEINTLKLARLLSENRWKVHLITTENSTLYMKGKDDFAGVDIISKPAKYFDFLSAYKISRLLKKQGIECVLVTYTRDIDVLAWTKFLFYRKLKIVYQQHMQIGIRKKDLFHTIRYRALSAWISPLRSLKEEVIAKTCVPSRKIHVIPIGVETCKLSESAYTRSSAREKLHIPDPIFLIGIMGRVSERKGQDFLVNAILELKRKNFSAGLLIFGSPTVNDPDSEIYYRELVQFVKTNELDGLIYFKDHSEDIALFYSAIDLFALASEKETYGMVTIEAMLSKVPVIATNSGGTPEILKHGNFGMLYPYRNMTGFCEKVMWMDSHTRLVEKMVENAYCEALDKYTSEREIQLIEELLGKIESVI